MPFDIDLALAAETQKKILDQTATDRLMVADDHLPFPSFGHVARYGGAYRFVPYEGRMPCDNDLWLDRARWSDRRAGFESFSLTVTSAPW
jgi:hypothetical protein